MAMELRYEVLSRVNIAMDFAGLASSVMENVARQVPLSVEVKPDSSLVTNVDKEIDRIFRERLNLSVYKNDPVVSEEGGQKHDASAQAHWILDSIDGTSNFVNGIPQFGITLGLQYKGEMVHGINIIPAGSKLLVMAALNGMGLQINGKTFSPPRPVKNIGGMDFQRSLSDPALKLMPQLVGYAGEMRVIGSVAYGLSQVALGRLGFYVHSGPKVWDLAGSLAILKEAGRVTNLETLDLAAYAGNDYSMGWFVAAQDEKVLSEVLAIVQPQG